MMGFRCTAFYDIPVKSLHVNLFKRSKAAITPSAVSAAPRCISIQLRFASLHLAQYRLFQQALKTV